ncbi:MAG TPA: glycosyltransferase [Gemmatimonadales bacterium]
MTGAGATPRVSVVMAVLDGEHHVRHGVGSLLAQTYPDFELIVVNDGSTDGTADAVRSFGDERIRMVENERNLGLAASLNRGLALARGEFVARQDVDDASAPERLARQVAFMDAHPEVSLLGSWYREVDASGVSMAERQLPVEHEDILWALHFHSPFVHSAVLWRRAPVRDMVGGYDERLRYSMDYDLWCRAAEQLRTANLPAALLALRVHDQSMTATYGPHADEGRRMRAARAARILRWEAGRVGADEVTDAVMRRFERLYSLLHGPLAVRSADELRQDLADLRRLHDVFCAGHALAGGIVRGQQSRMARRLARRLAAAARRCAAAGRPGDALAHLAQAALSGFRASSHVGPPLGRTPGHV